MSDVASETETLMERAWYVLYTAPQMERAVMRRIINGLEVVVFQPMRREEERLGGKRRMLVKALFPRYLFFGVAGEADRYWLKLREIDGILGVLGCDGAPLRLRASVLDAVIAACSQAPVKRTTKPPYVAGEKVRIVGGPFAAHHAEIDQVVDNDQVSVLVTLFGREFPKVMPLDQIEKLA